MFAKINSIVTYLKYWKPFKKVKKFNKDNGCSLSFFSNVDNTITEGNIFSYGYCNISFSHIGYGTYFGENCRLTNCKIGRFCSISNNVNHIRRKHPLNCVSTSPSFYSSIPGLFNGDLCSFNFNEFEYEENEGEFGLIIGNDVWIGTNVLIKTGVTIGNGAVVGMGSVVTKDIPPYAIVAGNPAKIIRYRFSEEQIKALLEIKWWDWPLEVIKERKDDFNDDIDEFIKKYGKK